MIFVRDKGQMCNNILQYAHMYAWGREHGQKTMSMRFAYKYQYFNICHTKYHCFPVYAFAKYAACFGLIKTMSFDELMGEEEENRRLQALSGKSFMVEGWQVRFYGLFLKYKREILQLFAFNKDIADGVEKYIQANSPNAVIRIGVHIRRGDYKTWCGGKYFFSDEVYVAYIRKCLEIYGKDSTTVCICTNDRSLDKEYYRRHLGDVGLLFPQGNPAEDLCLLSRCDYLIGAPSTFSLVASMYRDVPLCWMEEADAETMRFDRFDNLFKNIH